MRRPVLALAGLALVFAGGLILAVGAFGARGDTPIHSQTYDDPKGDAPTQTPDIAGVTVDNFSNGTLEFDVALPDRPVLPQYTQVAVRINSDRDKSTGDADGFDYAVDATGAGMSPPSFEFLRWQNNTWTLVNRADGSFTGQVGLVFTLEEAAVHVTTGFDFEVSSVYFWGGANLRDDAPGTGAFSYTIGTPATTSTTTTTAPTTTTVTTTPKPKKKKPPFCKKGQHSTKKHPCRKR